ncbi:MAG: flagellar basal body protein [Lachnospiraceae bacterium]|nr:flagellar basal body protein [Lachnospiraceae bacterium]
MANGFGSLFVGSSGLRGAQNALNVVANNLSNLDTTGYVRQRVAFEDEPYNTFANAAVSPQRAGLGVAIGDVIHARDIFLDRAYRTENGRQSFYQANYDAADQVQVELQETTGQQFSDAVKDLYQAFAEFAKDPSADVNQNLVVQKAQLFISRAKGVYDGINNYQVNLNTKIKDDVDRINEIGKQMLQLNRDIQRIEAGGVETAMQLRDQRDSYLDELSKLAKIEYSETWDGIVKIKIEGVDFVTENMEFEIGLKTDDRTGFYNPYWKKLSDPTRDDYAFVFDTSSVDPIRNTDIGEIKGLLLARGDDVADYTDMDGLSSYEYDKGLGNSILMNSESELDKMVHNLITQVNDLLSPITSLSDYGKYDVRGLTQIMTTNEDGTEKTVEANGVPLYDADGNVMVDDNKQPIKTLGLLGKNTETGKWVTITENTKIFDDTDPALGSDGKIPTEELFKRNNCDRYTFVRFYKEDGITPDPQTVTYTDHDGVERTKEIEGLWVYNEEDDTDTDTLYSMNYMTINQNLVEKPALIPHVKENGNIDYTMGQDIYNLWEKIDYQINPSDETPTSLMNFYNKWVGELATTGSIYNTTAESLSSTRDSIEASRQQVIGVGSDDELSNMIKYQNAYNASSRYINVVSQMIDYLLSSLSG